jgi:putative protease
MKRDLQAKSSLVHRDKMTLPELLAPAGTLEKLKTAVHYGADAVYLGGEQFSLRAKAGNFTLDQLIEGVRYAHARGVKAYATVNIFARNADLQGISAWLKELQGAQVDGVIVADPGVLELAVETVPMLPVHLSTQSNVTNARSAAFWHHQGAQRLNLARELSLGEIKEIRSKVDVELEVFVHGALCISYSGRCLLSTVLTGRDANRGDCAQPCRFRYALVEEKRPGQYFPIVEDSRGSYIFNAKDLCLVKALPLLMAAGVDAIKIEGRMRSIFYVGTAVRLYRAALDYLQSLPPEVWDAPEKITLPAAFVEEANRIGTRGTSANFALATPSEKDMLHTSSRLAQEYEPVAVIRAVQAEGVQIEVRNTLREDETIEFLPRTLRRERLRVRRMLDAEGKGVVIAHPGDRARWLLLETDPPIEQPEVNGIFRRAVRGG